MARNTITFNIKKNTIKKTVDNQFPISKKIMTRQFAYGQIARGQFIHGQFNQRTICHKRKLRIYFFCRMGKGTPASERTIILCMVNKGFIATFWQQTHTLL